MSAGEILLWIILPYVAVTVFVVGHWWRYRHDQFAWTSRSTQLLDRRILGWASPAFHYGALAAVGGHVIGLCIPASFTEALGISESFYRWFAAIAGCRHGHPRHVGRARRTGSTGGRPATVCDAGTTRIDVVTYLLLTVLIVMGSWMTFGYNLATASPYDYRVSIGEWWRSLPTCNRTSMRSRARRCSTSCMRLSPGFSGPAFPFSRLVHAWSIPLQYLGRPYILYRRRYNPGRTTIR